MNKVKDNKTCWLASISAPRRLSRSLCRCSRCSRLEIIGMGQAPSRGLKKECGGEHRITVTAIQRALEEARLMADCKIREVFTGIAGSHIRASTHGMVAIRDKEVSQADVDRDDRKPHAQRARGKHPTDQQILHPAGGFIIDGREDVKEPLGMAGVRLEVKVHIVTGAVSAAQNIMGCVRRCGLEVSDLILQPLARPRQCCRKTKRPRRVSGGHWWRYYRYLGVCRRQHSPRR